MAIKKEILDELLRDKDPKRMFSGHANKPLTPATAAVFWGL
jgi:hypothetical protein